MGGIGRWELLLGISLALGMLLAAGCYAPETGTPDLSSPQSTIKATEEAPPETAEEELARLKKTLQNFVREQDNEVNRVTYHAMGGDFDDLLKDEAYDSMRLLGKSKGWAVCLWREGLTDDGGSPLRFMGKYAAALNAYYMFDGFGVYLIKGDEVITLSDACSYCDYIDLGEDIPLSDTRGYGDFAYRDQVIRLFDEYGYDYFIDPEEVYLMLPEDTQWGLNEDHPLKDHYYDRLLFVNC